MDISIRFIFVSPDVPDHQNLIANCALRGTDRKSTLESFGPLQLGHYPNRATSLRQTFPQAAQFEFALYVAQRLGYDLNRGRLDLTHHPFSTRLSAGDVRITTRVNEHGLGDALFSTLHEAGHAMYEQGVSVALDGTPLGKGVSAGVHESQSRLWENIVGRSSCFWDHFYPSLQRAFPGQLGSIPIEVFHRAINKVARSIIRTDADEVTYNLHIMLRFEWCTTCLFPTNPNNFFRRTR